MKKRNTTIQLSHRGNYHKHTQKIDKLEKENQSLNVD